MPVLRARTIQLSLISVLLYTVLRSQTQNYVIFMMCIYLLSQFHFKCLTMKNNLLSSPSLDYAIHFGLDCCHFKRGKRWHSSLFVPGYAMMTCLTIGQPPFVTGCIQCYANELMSCIELVTVSVLLL